MHINKLNLKCPSCNYNKFTRHPSEEKGYFCNKCSSVYIFENGKLIPREESRPASTHNKVQGVENSLDGNMDEKEHQNERERVKKIYLTLPDNKRRQMEEEFLRLKIEFQARYGLIKAMGYRTDGSYVAAMINYIAEGMMPKHGLSGDEFQGLAHYTLEKRYGG